MPFIVDGIELLHNGEKYTFAKKHRVSGNSNASVWTCSYQEEFNLVDEGLKKEYTETRVIPQAYNLQKGLHIIGRNNVNTNLKIAKFVNSSPKLWHGYPADHIKNNQDRPTLDILKKMCTDDLISVKQMRKISRGQKI